MLYCRWHTIQTETTLIVRCGIDTSLHVAANSKVLNLAEHPKASAHRCPPEASSTTAPHWTSHNQALAWAAVSLKSVDRQQLV